MVRGEETYLARMFRETEEANRHEIAWIVHGSQPERMVDLGCGDGTFTFQLAKASKAQEVHGVEIDPDRAAAARMMGIKVEEADLNRPLPYDTGYFDLVHSNQVIEHLYDTDTYLSEIRRILKPGGMAVLSTNNLSSWHNIVSLVFGWQPPPMHPSGLRILGNPFDPFHGEAHPTKGDGHLRLFTIRAFTEVAALHGLYPRGKVKTVGYYPLTGFPAAVASWLDRRHGVFIVGVFS